ncbi:MAG: glycogen/starch synthase [Bacteroidota bacterium]
MGRKKVLFVSSEMSPFLTSTSSVSEIARLLPQAIQEKDNEIRVLVPRFGLINERRNRLHEVVRLSGINITIDDNDNPLIIKVASLPDAKMQVYFLDNEEYFHRKALYHNEENQFFPDNDERTIFFCKGALETVKKLGWAPDIIHCQGWMTSLIPLYLKTIYKNEPVFKNSKVIYSIFEKEFQENLGEDFARKASLNNIEPEQMACYDNGSCNGLYLGAITHADAVVRAGGNIDPEVENTISKLERPVLTHDDDQQYADNYLRFYDEILSSNN